MKPREAPALLVMGHGTRSQEGVGQCLKLVDRVERRAPELVCASGFIELAQPDLGAAIDDLVERGVRRIVAVPLVLLGAGHLKNDGPAALAGARERHGDVQLIYGRDLGIHPLVLAASEERIREALALLRAVGPEPDVATVLVGRGSTDPDANSDLYKVARLLQESRGLRLVEPAFVSLAPPSVGAALERCRRLGAARIAVVPYFLFTGVLVERIDSEALSWAARSGGAEVVTGDVMGPDERLAALVLERYEAAAAGKVSMSCDCCVYRAPLPGHEWRVGVAAATLSHAAGGPHDHPRDAGGR